MDKGKIKITWEDVHNKQVDEAIKKQEHIQRTQEHQTLAAQRPVTAAPAQSSLLRQSLVYLALFGLIGGILAWGLGEIVQQVEPKTFEEYVALHVELVEMVGDNRQVTGRLEALIEQYAETNPYFALDLAYYRDEITKTQHTIRFEALKAKENRKRFIFNTIFLALVGLVLAVFLSIAEPVVNQNWNRIAIDGSIAAVLGLFAGFILSLFINKLYHALGGGQGGDALEFGQMAARSIGWGVFGLFMAIAPGLTMRSPKKTLIGLAGGALGGLLGGLMFDPIAYLTDSGVVSRAAGIVSIGVLSGLAIGLIEDALKTGWFKVISGLIAGKQFILYRNPTSIGSSPQCDIYLFKDRAVDPRHALVHLLPGKISIQGVGQQPTYVNGQAVGRKQLRNGDMVQIGGTVFTFQERS